jgi:hypothetical protein
VEQHIMFQTAFLNYWASTKKPELLNNGKTMF